MEEEHPVYTRTEAITEADDKNLAGATKEYRNDLQIIIPENPFPEIEVDSYPPLKFSWVIPKKLAAMAFPRNKENVQFIVNQGITHLVTLTAGKKPPVDDVARLNWTEIPIEEFGVPDLEQIKKFIDVCKRADKSGESAGWESNTRPFDAGSLLTTAEVMDGLLDYNVPTLAESRGFTRIPKVTDFQIKVIGVHCRQGRTRCGVMLASYLIHFHRFEPDQAMNVIRIMRPGSCDCDEAHEAVDAYYAYLTEDNPLRFGVSGELMEEWVETARTYTKKVLGEL